MNLASSQFSFLKAVPVALTVAELEIPPHPDGIGPNQGYRMFSGDRFVVYSPGRKLEGHFMVRDWLEAADGMPRRVDMENVLSGSRLYLTGWQVSVLEAQGRIRATSLLGGDSAKDDGITLGLALAFDAAKLADAERRLGYVMVCLAKFNQENEGRSSKRLVNQAVAEHAAKLGEHPPCYGTAWDWIKTYRRSLGDPLVDLADGTRPGNPGSQFGTLIDDMVDRAVTAAWKLENGNWRTVEAEFNKQVREAQEEGTLPKVLPKKGEPGYVKLPSDRTFQRRMYQLNQYDRLRLRYNEEHANREMAFYIRQHLPDCPLDIVDVDHVTLDVIVIDDQYPVAFGRPDLIVFRDRRTGSILGFSLSFRNPSYESFLEGLRHAVFPKDMSAYPGLQWHAWGRFAKLGVDNALHLVGDNIANAARQLGFEIVEYRPGHPWEKGALEQLNGMINAKVSHGLPGSTTSGIEEREKHGHGKQGQESQEGDEAVLFISELEAFLVTYFCGTYHRNPQSGLGFLRSLKGVPEQLWNEGIAQAPNRPPIDPSIFVRLAGDVNEVRISDFGVRLDHIIYISDELLAIRTHPDHKPGSGRHRSTSYRAIRDPSDLGRIWVEDPYRKTVIEARACSEHYAYANGRRLFQHRKIVEYHLAKHGQVHDAADLQRSMDDYQNAMVDFLERRKKHAVARKLAAFVASQGRKITRSERVEAVTSANASAARINPANPERPARARLRASPADTRIAQETGAALSTPAMGTDASGSLRAQDPVPVATKPAEEAAVDSLLCDIEFLKSKHKGYD